MLYLYNETIFYLQQLVHAQWRFSYAYIFKSIIKIYEAKTGVLSIRLRKKDFIVNNDNKSYLEYQSIANKVKKIQTLKWEGFKVRSVEIE